MPQKLKKVRPGEALQIPAATWNALIDAARKPTTPPSAGPRTPAPPSVVRVKCTQDGGTAGSRTAFCSYTYTIKTWDEAATLATGVTVASQRLIKARVATAATMGLAYRDVDTWYLIWCDESYSQHNC